MPNGMIRTVTRLLAQLFRNGLVQGIASLEEADRVLRAQGYLPDAPPPRPDRQSRRSARQSRSRKVR
jgi:hypothetical protein